MIDWIAGILHLIDAELGRRTVGAALLCAFGISWTWTQWTKGLPVWWHLTDAQMRWATRLGAFLSGAVPAFLVWPVWDISAAVIAVAIGMLSPTLYLVTVRLLVWKWPSLDTLFSARPDPNPCRYAPPKPPGNAGKTTQ